MLPYITYASCSYVFINFLLKKKSAWPILWSIFHIASNHFSFTILTRSTKQQQVSQIFALITPQFFFFEYNYPTIDSNYYKTPSNFSSLPLRSSNNDDDSSSFSTFLISKLVILIALTASPSQSVLAKTAYNIETAQAA